MSDFESQVSEIFGICPRYEYDFELKIAHL